MSQKSQNNSEHSSGKNTPMTPSSETESFIAPPQLASSKKNSQTHLSYHGRISSDLQKINPDYHLVSPISPGYSTNLSRTSSDSSKTSGSRFDSFSCYHRSGGSSGIHTFSNPPPAYVALPISDVCERDSILSEIIDSEVSDSMEYNVESVSAINTPVSPENQTTILPPTIPPECRPILTDPPQSEYLTYSEDLPQCLIEIDRVSSPSILRDGKHDNNNEEEEEVSILNIIVEDKEKMKEEIEQESMRKEDNSNEMSLNEENQYNDILENEVVENNNGNSGESLNSEQNIYQNIEFYKDIKLYYNNNYINIAKERLELVSKEHPFYKLLLDYQQAENDLQVYIYIYIIIFFSYSYFVLLFFFFFSFSSFLLLFIYLLK